MSEINHHSAETAHGHEHASAPAKPEGLWKWLTRNVKDKISQLLGWGDDGHAHAHGHGDAHGEKPADNHGPKPEASKAKPHEGPKLEESTLEGIDLFLDKFKPEIKHVLYPCSGVHGITKAFPHAHVTYVDKEQHDVYTKAGLDAHKMSILDFKPAHNPDLLVLFNPTLKKPEVDKVAEMVKPGKYVLCNDYHRTAQYLHSNPDFEFVGVVEHRTGDHVPQTDRHKLVTENLEQYFNEADTDEKLKKFFPEFFEENEKEMKEKEPGSKSVLEYCKKNRKDAFARLFEAGKLDDYYFFRRKQPSATSSTSADGQALPKAA